MTGKRMSEGSRHILIEILTGIFLYLILGSIVLMFMPLDKLPAILGFFVGTAMNFASMIHITYVTETVVDMRSQKEASRYYTTRYLIRFFLMGTVIVLAYFTKYLNMLTLIAGLFGIKIGAYLQPYTHRILERYVYGR